MEKRLIEIENKNKKRKGIVDISSFYPPYTTRRSRFATKTDSAPPQNPLYQHSRSCHSRSRSPAKRTPSLQEKLTPRAFEDLF
jgi:hypothetical protein